MADIVLGAKQIKNPKGIKPELDSDVSSNRKPHRDGYVHMSTDNYYEGASGPNNQNFSDKSVEAEPKKHPLDEWFGRGIKRSNGLMVPNDHPAVQQTDN